MNNSLIKSMNLLPAVAPDLILVQYGAGSWQVFSLSERMGAWLGVPSSGARGRVLSSLLGEAIPPLEDMCQEVLSEGADLSDVKVRLGPDQPALLADIQFAGLTEDYAGQLVRINFRRESTASRLETGFRGLVGAAPGMREVFRKIRLYAASDATVVITGETGAGKELVARALHDESSRNNGPYAAINCTAISEQLLESELFGHEKGSFTGAMRDHRGHFEQADGGTLFLDELGDMPLHTQSKLLRVLEDGRVQRIGSERYRQVDVRVVGATNVSLEQAVAGGRFRADLYHRLAILRIHLPSLRDRMEDIPLLVDYFLEQFNVRYAKGVKRLTPEALALLQSYLWPGNVRELRNVLERVFVETEAEAIGARAFSEWVRERQDFHENGLAQVSSAAADEALRQDVEGAGTGQVIEAEYLPPRHGRGHNSRPVELRPEEIRSAYRHCEGNLSAAARKLGVHRATLYRALERLGLSRDDLH